MDKLKKVKILFVLKKGINMIDILLATYNGEKYIEEQINSIINQTMNNWFLYIKDDCSTDNTLKIVLDYEKKYSDKIKVIKSDIRLGSAKDNFFSMLKLSSQKYTMLCDQDDVWKIDKIEKTYNCIKATEEEYGQIPILVHTDLEVVDEKLNKIADSFFEMQNLNYKCDKLNNLLVQNIVTGCSVMFNNQLRNCMSKIPKHAIIHDWWIAIVASAVGKIVFLNDKTLLYRQHSKNSVGAKNVRSFRYIFRKLNNLKEVSILLKDTYAQSEEILKVVKPYVNSKNYQILNTYSQIPTMIKIKRWITINNCGFWKNGIIRALGQIIFC